MKVDEVVRIDYGFLKLIQTGEVILLVSRTKFRRVFPAEGGQPPLEGRKVARVFRFSLSFLSLSEQGSHVTLLVGYQSNKILSRS